LVEGVDRQRGGGDGEHTIRLILRHWRLIYADWRREYGRDLMADLDDGMSWWEFAALLSGLSPESVWRQVAAKEPVEVDSATARSVISNL
jgi:hypothetical protein